MSWRSLLCCCCCLALAFAAHADTHLDVGVVVFDPGIPADVATHTELRIFPRIREAEAQYLPVNLQRALQDAGQWGAVRVVPRPNALYELLLEGRIVESTGQRLRLHLSGRDASGRVWLQREYVAEAAEDDYPVPPGADPFAGLYREIAADLDAVRLQLDAATIAAIRHIALMRYAAALAPEAFASYLAGGEAEPYRLLGLPAEGDPMIERVLRIRNQEYQFIDHVDEQYGQLHDRMAETYSLWRQYDREQSLYKEEYLQRAATRDSAGRRGSFSAMQQSYYAYRAYRLQEQDLAELAGGFNNETAPTLIEASGQVYRLTGTLDNQYLEWQGILRDIFAIEVGLPPSAGASKDFAVPSQ
ncbi:hypothetical protein F0M18_00185 [Pseudohalioglobus sediminis]|uniref:Uncharacterized protein n=1 Tax=Pseudohalioglobus sediminis TaxID=2606449 RepID=A0A5B0X3S8_9GAMM|nr:hypothetical protein [Pseudohalioglobus sediminis]KAA1193902.1 hypothetical protein F0M18_00185 [Pseudohalioglobus sediminis]